MRNGVVVLTGLVAMVTDWKYRKIPNLLTFPVIFLGLLLGGISGLSGFGSSAGGLLLGLAITFPLFAFNLIGAGDVKLVLCFGALKGLASPPTVSFVLWAFLYGALIGGVFSLCLFGLSAIRKTSDLLVQWGLTGPRPVGHGPSAALKAKIPYALPLTMGAFVALLLEFVAESPAPWLKT
ncbi:MAG: prepilin peptidase [Armatimonadetes bacterium]|nr:prepilin peptidase [Armatimonadota bacterium]MDW8121659.1 prepilin peptidase [Armatimonadota bacterium]